MAEMSMEDFKAKLERWHKDYPKECEKAMKRAAEIVRGQAVSKHLSGPKMASGSGSLNNATLGTQSGALKASITTAVRSSGGKILAEIGNMKMPLKYAKVHEFGAVIKAKGNALRFKIGDRWIFAKQVTIPARPFLMPSLRNKKEAILDMLRKAIKRSYNDA